MIDMGTKFDDKILKRLERFESRGSEFSSIGSLDGLDLISSRGYKGLCKEGTLIIPPVFDDLTIYPHSNLGSVEICGLLAVVDLESGDLLTDFDYDNLDFSSSDHSIVLVRDGLKGLFDVESRRIIHDARFSAIDRSPSKRFSWTYSAEEGYTVIDMKENLRTCLGQDVDVCFDEKYGHIFVYRDKKIRMLTETGTEDLPGYRKLLSSIGGRLSLYNSCNHIAVVADIYGRVL